MSGWGLFQAIFFGLNVGLCFVDSGPMIAVNAFGAATALLFFIADLVDGK